MKIFIVVENFPKEQTRILSLMEKEIKEKIAKFELAKILEITEKEISVVFHIKSLGIYDEPPDMFFTVFSQIGEESMQEINFMKDIGRELVSITNKYFKSTDVCVVHSPGCIINF